MHQAWRIQDHLPDHRWLTLMPIPNYGCWRIAQIAVSSTIPWDSYLIRNRIWTYPPNVIIGPKIFDIPLEEVFFFIVQTYNTSLLYLIINKPTLHPTYLRSDGKWRRLQWLGQIVLGTIIASSLYAIQRGGEAMYMGLILIWAGPFLLLLWYVPSVFTQSR